MKRNLDYDDHAEGVNPITTKRPKPSESVTLSNIGIESKQSSDEDEAESTGDSSSSSTDESNSDEATESDEISDEESSQVSSSSGEDSPEGEPQSESEDIVNVLLQAQPSIQLVQSSDLKSRLSSFLPALAAANASLDKDREDGKLPERVFDQDEGDKGQYIEMDLGLGVLEEKSDGILAAATTSPSSLSVDGRPEASMQRSAGEGDRFDVMATLMGGISTRANIEELEGS